MESPLLAEAPEREDGYYTTLKKDGLYVDLGSIGMAGLYRMESGEVFILADLPWSGEGWNRYKPQHHLLDRIDLGALRAIPPGEAAMILFQCVKTR